MADVIEKPPQDDEVNQKLKINGIVVWNPKPNKGLTSKLVDLVEKLIVKLMCDTSQPLHFITGNFAPVIEETPPTKDLNVIGLLEWRVVRIGPNPKFKPVAGYNWFDGDG